jgi:hypothetical protein
MASAIRTILIADLVMSLDNVIAVAAASRGDTFLLVAGLLISIPLVVYGSTLLLKVVERYPLIVWGGAALLGYVAGDIAIHDPAIESWATAQAGSMGVSLANLGRLVGLAGAVLVVALAWVLLRRRRIAALGRGGSRPSAPSASRGRAGLGPGRPAAPGDGARAASGGRRPPHGVDAPPGGRRHPFVNQFLRRVRTRR